MNSLTAISCVEQEHKSLTTIRLLCSSSLLLLFTQLLAFSDLTHAEEKSSKNTLTVDEVLAGTLSKSPLVKQVDAVLADKIADAISTRLLPNPMLDADVRFPGSYIGSRPDNEVEVSLGQSFRLSHFGLRTAVADLISKAAYADQKIELLELTQKVRLTYARVWALQAQKAVVEAARKRASSVANLISESSKKGLLPISDAKLFEAETRMLEAQTLGLEADISRARADLIRTTGLDLAQVKFIKPDLLSGFNTDDLLKKVDAGQIPVQQRAKLLAELATEQRKVAERDAFPMLTPRVLYQHTPEGEEQYGVGISIALPFFDQNQAEKTRKVAQERVAETEQQYFLGSAYNSQLTLLVQSLKAANSQVKIYETKVLPALEESLSGANKQLQAGQGSVIQVFQTQRELNAASSKVVEILVQAISNKVELSVLTGADL